jgi:hypothetical protein
MLPFAPVISGLTTFALGLAIGRLAFRKTARDFDRLWTPRLSPAEEAERIARYQRWRRQRYAWHNPPTGVTLEDRANLGTGGGLWLCRGDEAVSLPLNPEEVLMKTNSVVVAAEAPTACVLLYKQHTPADHRAFDFSRLAVVQLPARDESLNIASLRTIVVESSCSQWWISELEGISSDGQRVLLRRADQVDHEPGIFGVTYRTFRLNLSTCDWESVEP